MPRVDALSEVLKVLRLNTGFFLEAQFTAPWCIDSAPGKDDLRNILPHAEHVSIYHLVTEGACKAKLPDDSGEIELAAGDLILFPHGECHRLGSDLHRAPVRAEALVLPGPDGAIMRIEHGGGGARTRFVCGYLACDERLCRPLIDSLPRMLRVPVGDGAAGAWVMSTLQRGAAETLAPKPGTGAVLAKLSELLFVEAIRRHIEMHPQEQRGWFAGLRDPHVGAALALLHADPGRAWTVDEIGREVSLSRSTLAGRFTELIGEPPMQYLTRWRLALAAQVLGNGHEPLARVAARVGYESDAAFNRAFKREFGMPPAAWRRLAMVRAVSSASAKS
jgi:AraC-like DNA-binding protein